MTTQRKKSLEGWTYPDWNMSFVKYCPLRIDKIYQRKKFYEIDTNRIKPVKVRITIEQLPAGREPSK